MYKETELMCRCLPEKLEELAVMQYVVIFFLFKQKQ
jgi:hypothetical protein